MPEIESIWISRKLALAHANECANKLVEDAGMVGKFSQPSWDRVEVVDQPDDNSCVVEVRASRGVYTDGQRDWSSLRKWFIENHTLRGDVVSALAAVAP